jgi:hypothetical protein
MSDTNLLHDGFETRTKQLFDDSVGGLDGATRSRLTRARHRALEELAHKKAHGWRWSIVPAGGVAVAAALAVLLFMHPQPPAEPKGLQASSLGDLEILLGEEDLQMLDEDMEFYGWLEEQPELKSAGDSVG